MQTVTCKWAKEKNSNQNISSTKAQKYKKTCVTVIKVLSQNAINFKDRGAMTMQ